MKVELECKIYKSTGGGFISSEMCKELWYDLEWLVRLLNISFDRGSTEGACLVPLYKGEGDKYECGNSSVNSLLSVVYKLYGRVLIYKS